MSDQEDEIDNLFGSDSESQDEDARDEIKKEQLQQSARDELKEEQLEDLEDEDVEQDQEQRRKSPNLSEDASSSGDEGYRRDAPIVGPPITVEAPLIPIPPSNTLYLMRTSNIVSINVEPFDPDVYVKEEETYIEESTGQRRVKLRDNGVIRWRVKRQEDGSEKLESNARFVKWSDGSWQLLLGEEALDVTRQDITENNLFLFNVSGSILQGQAALRTKLAFRPASLNSVLHRRLRDEVDKRQSKMAKVQSHTTLENPEREKAEKEKKVEDEMKNRVQLGRAQERVLGKFGLHRGDGARHLSEGYLEEGDIDEDEEEGGGRGGLARSRAFDEAEAARRLTSAKRSAPAPAPSTKRRRGGYRSEEEEESEPEELPSDEQEEEEYVSSGDDGSAGGDEEEEEEEKKPKVKSEKKGGRSKSPMTQAKAAPLPAKVAVKARRGVVMSDDEDD